MRRPAVFGITVFIIAVIAAGCIGPLAQPRTGTVAGIVTIDGQPPGDIAVEVVVAGTETSTRAEPDGAFRLQLPAGEYELETHGAALAVINKTVEVRAGRHASGIVLNTVYVDELPTPPILLDLDNDIHSQLIEQTYPSLDFSIQPDPFGETALFFPQGRDDQAPPEGYQAMRFVLLGFSDIDEFELHVEQLGVGGENPPQANPNVVGGNRSLSIVFGYEDINNWWVIYYTYTNSTSVRRMKDGKQEYICRPMDLDQWMPNNDEYQLAEVRLTREGDEMVVSAQANGEPISIDGCRFPASDYTPGKVGLGGHSTSAVQSWYFKNIFIDTL